MPDSLVQLAAAARDRAPILKPYLPPCGVALRLATGQVMGASGIPINTVMEAPAVQRALYRYLRDTAADALPPIVAAAAAGAVGANPCELADLVMIAVFAAPDAALYVVHQDGSLLTTESIRGRFSHLPQAAVRMMGWEQGGYTLHLAGTATGRDGHPLNLGDWRYPDFQLTTLPDPTDLTPARAMIADLYEQAVGWNITAIMLDGQGRDGGFPLSGRDLQVLRRALPETTPVIWNGTNETLASLMPGAYQSNFTRFRTATQTAFWQDISRDRVAVQLGGMAVLTRVEGEVLAFARTAPVQPPRVAAVVMADGHSVCAGHVPLHGLNVPSCAESHALRRAISRHPATAIQALVLMMHENHTDTPLLGVDAAPCGFCRTCIMAACAADTPVILTDGQGRFQWAPAGDLLKYQAFADRARQPAVAAAEDDAGNFLSITTLGTGKPDCDYPPAIGPELAYQGGRAARHLMLYDPDAGRAGQLGAYTRHWLARAAADPAVRIDFDVPDGPMPDPLRAGMLFGNLKGFDFTANGRFVDGRSLHLQHETIIAGDNVVR